MTVREHVLKSLTAGGERSGSELAREIGVSRNAVWKAVEALRKEGYRIEGGTRRGYRLLTEPDRLSEEAIRGWLTTESIGREIEMHDQIDSTNRRARALAADGAPHGFAVVADSQTGGRGRRGRSFFSPRGSGIYLSLILRPDCAPDLAGMITSMTAVAAARAIEAVADTDVRIKWVNDLYLGSRKCCGILCEAGISLETGRMDYAVAGIGINVQPMDFPAELAEIATSIGNETGRSYDRNRLIAEICNQAERVWGQLETGEFLAESRSRSNVIGHRVTVLEGEKQYTATALDLDDRGRLAVRRGNEVILLDYGEVSLRREE